MFSLRSHVSNFFLDFLPPPSISSYATSRAGLRSLIRGFEVHTRFDQSVCESYLGNFTEINFDRVTVSAPVRQAKHRKTLEECGETMKDQIFSSSRKFNVQLVRNLDLWCKNNPLYSTILTTLQLLQSQINCIILKQRIKHCPIAVAGLS